MVNISISRRSIFTILVLLFSFTVNAHIGQKMNEIALEYYDKQLSIQGDVLVVESKSATAYFGFKDGRCNEIAIIPNKGFELALENHYWSCSNPYKGTTRMFGVVDGKNILIRKIVKEEKTIYYIYEEISNN